MTERKFMFIVAMLACACKDPAPAGTDATAALDVAPDLPPVADTAPDATTDAATATFLGLPCPTPGLARIAQLGPGQKLTGPEVVGGPGDWLIANDRAAFVIQDVGHVHTWYPYGGILTDAVALEGCAQAAPERFGELGLLVGNLVPSDFPASTLRAFKGTSVEVVHDGKDGKAAILRVHGTDDYFWLVELTLFKLAANTGFPKPLSTKLGLDLAIDYILEPGSQALRIELHMTNKTAADKEVHTGVEIFLGDTTPPRFPAVGKLGVGGFTADTGMHWLGGANADGSHAIILDTQSATRAEIAGVSAYLDLAQVGAPIKLAPAGQPGAKGAVKLWLTVGGGDLNTATKAIPALEPGGRTWPLLPVAGVVREAAAGSGAPIAGAVIEVERQAGNGDWKAMDQLVADANGKFAGLVAQLGPEKPTRMRLHDLTRPPVAPKPLAEGETTYDFTADPGGSVACTVDDGKGKPLPARLMFYSGQTVAAAVFVGATGQGETFLPPGTYEVVGMRGFEHARFEAEVKVTAKTATPLKISLPRIVDTTGWMAFDGHVHSAPSGDSSVPMPLRVLTAAVEGLEVIIHTDHEVIVDWQEARKQSGVGAFVADVLGQEVTATLPEHMNMYGVPLDTSHPRGGFVPWYGLDMAQLVAAMKKRGAQIVTLNHPRMGGECAMLCRIKWNPLTAKPEAQDGTVMGLPKDATLWTWDFDAVELWNGTKDIYLDPANPDRTGLFEDWMSWWNTGHFIAGVAVTDEHGMEPLGSPRTYYKAKTDDPQAFDLADMTAAIKNDRLQLSAGAFAHVTANAVAGPGDQVTDSDGSVDLQVRIEALPQVDVAWLQVFVNCDEVAKVKATAPGGVVKFDGMLKVKVAQDAHIVVAAWGEKPMPRGMFQYAPEKLARVLTNPLRVDANGDGKWTPPGGKTCVYTRKGP